ncbi:MAG: carboxypeptidase-like regulatory domain-containing protein, partial [Deltaproteobacteria bacterium]|nr:carboxypeptidase-like regulatory domain-containing protein [Deltaproteobacteria bacterium]
MRRAAAALLIAAIACGAGDNGIDVPDNCVFDFTVGGGEPVIAPELVVLSADIVDANYVGVRSIEWSISYDGVEVPFTLREEFGFDIEFLADQPGPYQVIISGEIGDRTCDANARPVNVQSSGAQESAYALRVLAPGVDYGRSVIVYGGADYSLGTIDVALARQQLSVVDADDQPLDAYVRVLPAGLAKFGSEAASDEEGLLALALAPGDYELEIIPYDQTEAPFAAQVSAPNLPQTIGSPTVVDVAVEVVGVAGAAARVSRSDGPGASALTDGGGDALVPTVAAGSVTRVDVVPPAGSILPVITATEAGSAASLVVDYQTPAATSFGPAILDASGSPAAGAQVLLTAQWDDAAEVRFDDGPAQNVAGRHTSLSIADGSGDLATVLVPAVVYTAVLIHDGAVSVQTIDLTAGAPSSLQLASPVAISGRVSSFGSPVPGVRVRAVGQGVLAGLGAEPIATTDSSGNYSLPASLDGEYKL